LQLLHINKQLPIYKFQLPPKDINEPISQGEAIFIEASYAEVFDHSDIEFKSLFHIASVHEQYKPSREVHPLSVTDMRVLQRKTR
jgi:hypothetical protein